MALAKIRYFKKDLKLNIEKPEIVIQFLKKDEV
jgi:hypothetical protein